MNWIKDIQEPKFWLLGTASGLVALHLTLLSRGDNAELLSTSVLLWMAVASLVWDKRHTLNLESGVFSSFFGATLIALVLLRSLSQAGYHLSISPFISVLGLCLLASGAKRLHQYWKELLILGLLVLSPPLQSLLQLIDLPILTAKFAAYILWYLGFQVTTQGVFLLLPASRVEVYGACSGVHSIIQMFNIAVLFLLMVPTRWIQKILCLVIAIFIGFVVNAARVALMATLVASSRPEAFEYWHGGDGSLIFSMIAVVIFGCFCWFVFLRDIQKKPDPREC